MPRATPVRVRCRSCGRIWPAGRAMCPRCLADLPAAGAPNRVCRYCHAEWPPTMDMCPNCLAELDPDPDAARDVALATGQPVFRAAGVAPFSQGDTWTLRRLAGGGGLAYLAGDA